MRLNLQSVKDAGLELDLAALAAAGPDALAPADHYRLKTHGVCVQLQHRHRDEGAHMVRLRRPGGLLTPAQLAGLAALAEDCGDGTLKLTTRQNVELHSVPTAALEVVRHRLAALGITSRSACGHTVRNIMADPLPRPGAVDPVAYAVAIDRHVVASSARDNPRWPQRLNIAFAHARPAGTANRHQCLGFDIHPDGTADVWVGGSVGADPRPAELLLEGVPLARSPQVVRAVAETFIARARRDRPRKARLKYLVADVGVPALRQAVTARLADTADLELTGAPPRWAADAAALAVHVPGGDLTPAQARTLAGAAAAQGLALRVDREQNILLVSPTGDGLDAARGALAVSGLSEAGAGQPVDVRNCVGARYCSLAITASAEAAAQVRRALADAEGLPLRVAISGCPNSCAHHQTADVGLAGALVRAGGVTHQAYTVFLGGRPDDGVTPAREGERAGTVSAERAPHLVVGLAAVLASEGAEGERLADLVDRLGVEKVYEMAREVW